MKDPVTNPRVLQALAALAVNDRNRRVSPSVEARLLLEFKARQRFRAEKMRRRIVWTAGCGLAAAAAIFLSVVSVKQPLPPKSVAEIGPPLLEVPARAANPAVPHVVRKPRQVQAPRTQVPTEVATDFFSLMDPAPPFDRGQILRVQVPASAMRAVGLPVAEERLADPVQADVVVGEEGLIRAIRFVKFELK